MVYVISSLYYLIDIHQSLLERKDFKMSLNSSTFSFEPVSQFIYPDRAPHIRHPYTDHRMNRLDVRYDKRHMDWYDTNGKDGSVAISPLATVGEFSMGMRVYNTCKFPVVIATRTGVVTTCHPLSLKHMFTNQNLPNYPNLGRGIYVECMFTMSAMNLKEMMAYYESISPGQIIVEDKEPVHTLMLEYTRNRWGGKNGINILNIDTVNPSSVDADRYMVSEITDRFFLYIPESVLISRNSVYDKISDLFVTADSLSPTIYHPAFMCDESDWLDVVVEELNRRSAVETISLVSTHERQLYRRVGNMVQVIRSTLPKDKYEHSGLHFTTENVLPDNSIVHVNEFIPSNELTDKKLEKFGIYLSVEEARNAGTEVEMIRLRKEMTLLESEMKRMDIMVKESEQRVRKYELEVKELENQHRKEVALIERERIARENELRELEMRYKEREMEHKSKMQMLEHEHRMEIARIERSGKREDNYAKQTINKMKTEDSIDERVHKKEIRQEDWREKVHNAEISRQTAELKLKQSETEAQLKVAEANAKAAQATANASSSNWGSAAAIVTAGATVGVAAAKIASSSKKEFNLVAALESTIGKVSSSISNEAVRHSITSAAVGGSSLAAASAIGSVGGSAVAASGASGLLGAACGAVGLTGLAAGGIIGAGVGAAAYGLCKLFGL